MPKAKFRLTVPQYAQRRTFSTKWKKEGYAWATVPYVVGIHDFGQFYGDIFRKCYVHANKHLIHLPELVPGWKSRAQFDPDFEVAIEGLAWGLRERGVVRIDKSLESVATAFADLGLVEKSAMSSEEFSPAAIESLLKQWAADDVPVRGFPVAASEAIHFGRGTQFSLLKRILGSVRKKAREVGWMRVLPFMVGSGFERFGLLIKQLSSVRGRSRK